MRRTTSLLAMLAIFSFPCLSAFADSAEQRELLGLMKKLNGLLEAKSAGTEAASTITRRRVGKIVLLIVLSPRVGNTVFCTATMSVIGALSYTQAQTVRSTPPGDGNPTSCEIAMGYDWPHVDPNNVIQLNIVVTENCACPEAPNRVSHDLPSITIPPNGVTLQPIIYSLRM